MPTVIWLLIGLFTTVSIISGVLAAWLVGPRYGGTATRLLAVLLPTLAAFGGLWLVGHEGGPRVGPTTIVLGFELHLLFDILVALGAALLVALLQRPLLARLLARRRPS